VSIFTRIIQLGSRHCRYTTETPSLMFDTNTNNAMFLIVKCPMWLIRLFQTVHSIHDCERRYTPVIMVHVAMSSISPSYSRNSFVYICKYTCTAMVIIKVCHPGEYTSLSRLPRDSHYKRVDRTRFTTTYYSKSDWSWSYSSYSDAQRLQCHMSVFWAHGLLLK